MNLSSIFKPKGLLSKKFENYELRPQQFKMAVSIEDALTSKRHIIVEGGTGIGKSFAYLIPLILSEKSAIISTSHKSLQDQLSNKDLPALEDVLPFDFDWTVLKGKNNYFCHEHFKANQMEILDKGYLSKNQLQEMVEWSEQTEDGDIEYYPYSLSKRVKEMVTCDTRTTHEKDSQFYRLCFANKARKRARESRIVLVNHTLLALDTALKMETEGKASLLPEAKVIIIDEAHTFEHYASMAFSDEINIFSLRHFINWKIVRDTVPKQELNNVSNALNKVLRRFLPEKGDIYYKQRKVNKFDGLKRVIGGVININEKVKANPNLYKDEISRAKMREIVKEGENLAERLEVLSLKDKDMLRWSEAYDGRDGKPIVTLKSVPLNISKILSENLFEDKTVICTSATLAVNKSFDFFKSQLGTPDDTLELIVGSPFDYKRNALIYISSGEKEQIYEVEKLLEYSKGRAFVLFTSYREMERFHKEVNTKYPKLVQSRGISRAMLLEEFKKTPNAVLFATRSFWEGVDVQGDELMSVIIHKLPFNNPSDLVYSSKVERIDEEYGKGQHWTRYTIPDACLKLKQGVGRLIRSKTDIGTIALLDARVNYRSYKNAVLNSLPPAFRTQKLEHIKEFYKRKSKS